MAGIPEILRVRAFREVWLGSLASNAGSWLQVVASGWLILEATGSPAAVGALALVTRAPAIAFSAYAGGLADRFDRRLIGVWTFLMQAAASAALAVITFVDGIVVPAIYALTFVVGLGFALGLPAMLALIPSLVPPGRLSQAVSLNAAGINVARLAGPAIGGGVLVLFGATTCFALNAVSFLALVWALLRVDAPRAAERRRGSARMADALRFAAHDPAIRRLLVGMSVFTVLASPIQELAPVVADRLDAGATGLGLLLGAMGGGALGGAWLLERLHDRGYPRHLALPTATTLFACGMAVVALTPWFLVGLAGMAFAGAFWIWMFAATNTTTQLRSPPALLGRMLGLYQLSVIGPIAIGSTVAGLVAERIGIAATLAGCAGLLAAWGLWSLRNPVPEIDAPARRVATPSGDEGRDTADRRGGDAALDL